MDTTRHTPHRTRSSGTHWQESGALSATDALSPAWESTLHLLFRPFNRRRWITLSIVCIFLGGGTSTAAFQWGFGALPFDFHAQEFLARTQLVVGEHISLIVLAVVVGIGFVLSLIYVRCVLRFVLIEAVIKRDLAMLQAWKSLEAFGRFYFLWLIALVGSLTVAVGAAAIASLRFLGFLRDSGSPEWLVTVLLVVELVSVVGIGLLIAVIITLTDDLVAPLMYSERLSLPAAWRVFWNLMRRDSATYFLYVVLRLAVGMGISVGALIVLFPVLMGLSSGALISAAVVILALRVVGLAWVWNPVTIVLGVFALIIFTSLLFSVMSVIGMPGQVYLQNYGVRFIASRVPSLGALCRAGDAPMRRS